TAAARLFVPALSVGEIGAAAGPLALAMLAFFVQPRVVEGPALCRLGSGGGARPAAAVRPARGETGDPGPRPPGRSCARVRRPWVGREGDPRGGGPGPPRGRRTWRRAGWGRGGGG